MPLTKKKPAPGEEGYDEAIISGITDQPPQIDPQFTILRSDGFTAEVLNLPSADTPPPGAERGSDSRGPSGLSAFHPPPPPPKEAQSVEQQQYQQHQQYQQPPAPPSKPETDSFAASAHQQPHEDDAARSVSLAQGEEAASKKDSSRLSGVFHRRRSRSATTGSRGPDESKAPGKERRLSAIFHRHRSGSRTSRSPSPTLPAELEHILDAEGDPDATEAQWEKRATVLAQQGGAAPPPVTAPSQQLSNQPQQPPQQQQQPGAQSLPAGSGLQLPVRPGENLKRTISDAKSDDDIQKAIELHETGQLEQSTAMFGRLADPNGANNALSQVLYGLALRHGWGIPTDASQAVSYLSLAARNSAAVEAEALASGMKKGGAAKGELVLAIYELANCYKMGLGLAKDPVAARRYFETAARLGDVDALEAAARCYEDGYGGKKDKFMAAKYYRQAEEKGHKIVGNSWIWKEKYDPKPSGGS